MCNSKPVHCPLQCRYSYDSNPGGPNYNPYNPANEQGIYPGPDKAFFDSLYDDIASGRFGPLNHTHNHIIGFSSGGFWVSRLLAENSGLLRTNSGRPWPEIASAVMLCAGSFETYNGAYAVGLSRLHCDAIFCYFSSYLVGERAKGQPSDYVVDGMCRSKRVVVSLNTR